MWFRRPVKAKVIEELLVQGIYVEIATARPGEPFNVTEPFEVSFDPAILLPGATR
jgi:hypothetical protein